MKRSDTKCFKVVGHQTLHHDSSHRLQESKDIELPLSFSGKILVIDVIVVYHLQASIISGDSNECGVAAVSAEEKLLKK